MRDPSSTLESLAADVAVSEVEDGSVHGSREERRLRGGRKRREGRRGGAHEGRFDGEVIAQTAVEGGMAGGQARCFAMHAPHTVGWVDGGGGGGGGGAEEDVVETLCEGAFGLIPVYLRICFVDGFVAVDAAGEGLLPCGGPAPCIAGGIARAAFGLDPGADGGGRGVLTLGFRAGVVWGMGPDVVNAAVRCHELVCERVRQHVEVAARDREMASFARVADKLGDEIGLRGAVAEVAVVGFALVGGVEVRGEDFDQFGRAVAPGVCGWRGFVGAWGVDVGV